MSFTRPIRHSLILLAAAAAAGLPGCSKEEPGAGTTGKPGSEKTAAQQAQDKVNPVSTEEPKPYKGPLTHAAALTDGQRMSPKQWIETLDATTKPTEKEELVRMSVSYSPEAAPDVLKRASGDSDPAIRKAAVLAAAEVYTAQPMPEVLASGLADKDPEVRRTAVDSIKSFGPEQIMEVLGPALKTTQYQDVADAAVDNIAATTRKDACELLMTSAPSLNAATQTRIAESLGLLVQRQFADFNAASTWWEAAKPKLDDQLVVLKKSDPPPP